MGVFPFFKIAQMAPNCSKRHIWKSAMHAKNLNSFNIQSSVNQFFSKPVSSSHKPNVTRFLPLLNYEGNVLVLKNFFEGVGVFSILRGEFIWGTYQNRLWRGDSTSKTWIVDLLFPFHNLERVCTCFILYVLSCFCITISEHQVSKIWTWPKSNVCTEFFPILWLWWLFDIMFNLMYLVHGDFCMSYTLL